MSRRPEETRPPREKILVCGVLFPDQAAEHDACQGAEVAAGGCCEASASTCGNNPDCVSVNDCVGACNGDQTCIDNCGATYPNGVADYNALGLSLRRHPMELLRAHLARRRMLTAAEIRGLPHGRRARAAGIVGERPDGFVAPVSGNAPANIRSLIQSVNSQRLQKYQQIANEKGVPVEQVAALTAEKIIAKLKPGWYYMNSSGQWVTK